jgi:hypothetical protein
MTQHNDQFISAEDLALLRNTKSKAVVSALQAEKAILETQLADSEYRNLILSLCLKYNLNEQYSIDEATGKVIKPSQSPKVQEDTKNEDS